MPVEFVENFGNDFKNRLNDQTGLDALIELGKRGALESERINNALDLNGTLDSLTQMLSAIQFVAVEQGNLLRGHAEWQTKYTNLINDIDLFTATNNTIDGLQGNDDDPEENRSSLNTTLQQDTENLRSKKQVVSDLQKQTQSNLTQSNDAAGEQANVATAILQQLSGILSTIFR